MPKTALVWIIIRLCDSATLILLVQTAPALGSYVLQCGARKVLEWHESAGHCQALRLALCAPLSTSLGRECREFYSQYDGQSWKNVISIGGLAVAPSSRRDACWC